MNKVKIFFVGAKSLFLRFTRILKRGISSVFKPQKTISQKLDIRNINDELREFYCTSQWYKHSLTGTLYTDGVKELAEKYECYWLLNDILIYAASKDYQKEEFQVWRLDRVVNRNKNNKIVEKKNSFFLICEDGNYNRVGEPMYYSYSDFPGDTVTLWFTNNVLYLPSEH